ncbi:glycosyltransferase family 4 protein [Bradyrhizobium barranii subsp. barranii]|uniref:Glycosyltransferase family 4 protein n=1 Tax=Bradyrhizobium barranii subsp. barranii TaxID=2823807 RepID=A0A9X9YLH1_9BRAD|nr:glycosyltransferase family 4 protein [Bradyrhizobium barranii]UGX91776.1 glycosyltransferase family 4 protein [Bradyrhizobium barranii subsp. barranii]
MVSLKSNGLRVLVVSQHFWPENLRINEVVLSLRACGVDVEVLTGQPNYPKGEIYDGYSATGVGSKRHPLGYMIHRVPVVPRGGGGALRRMANYGSFVLSALLFAPRLTRGRPYDVIFVYAISPILQGLPAAFLKLLKRAALVIWVQDLWPDSLESTGYVRNKAALAAVAALTGFIYRRADLLLAQSRGFVQKIRESAGRRVPIAYHPNPGDIALVERSPAAPSSLAMEPDCFNVVFAGNLGSVQALETVVACAETIADPLIRIIFVGAGSRATWLREETARRGLRNIELAGQYPAEAMPAIFAQASALLVTLRRADSLALTIPSKIPSYLAAARPIIGALDGEGADLIRDAEAGLAVPAEDSAALASAILEMRNLPAARREAMGAAGRAYFDQHLAPGALAQDLVRHFHEALGRSRQGRT